MKFDEMRKMALDVEKHYDELQIIDGHKVWGTTERMSGFVKDVGDLSKLIMVKNNLRRGPENVDELLAHELSDCLWSILVIANKVDVDLETAFAKAMRDLNERIDGYTKEKK